jgi:hypothetical protein
MTFFARRGETRPAGLDMHGRELTAGGFAAVKRAQFR